MEELDKKGARQKMKQWYICTGNCGPVALYSNVIRAYTKEEAVQKLLETMDEEKTADEIAWYIDHCYEHTPVPRKKANET